MTNNIKEIYPLSKLQKGMIFHYALNPSSTEYFEQMELEIRGQLDIGRFKQSISYLVEKYDILRTAFVYKETKEPKQIVLREKDYVFDYIDMVTLKPSIQSDRYQGYLVKDRATPFDLAKGSLLRFCIFKVKTDQYKLVFSFHHIILDGWSIGIFFSELLNCYEKNLKVIDHTSGYEEMMESDIKQEEIDSNYWTEYLKNSKEPKDFFNTETSDQKKLKIPSKKTVILSEKETSTLNNLSRELSLPKNAIYESLWGILINKFDSSEDFIFGKVVSGRNLPGKNNEQTMGMFINTIPKRIKIDRNESLCKLIKKVNKDNLENLNHETYPLDDIQRRSPNGRNLFNQLFVYENYPIQSALEKNDINRLGFEIVYKDTFEQTNYNLNVIVSPGKTDEIIIRFNEGIYTENNIQLLLNYYRSLIVDITKYMDRPIRDIDLIDSEDRNLIENLNKTQRLIPYETIIDGFMKMVDYYPNRIAISYEGRELTYQDLAEKTSSAQNDLKKEGVKKGDRIGLYMGNSIEQVMYILAILSLGASYVPMDITVPFDRNSRIVEDSGVKLVISNQECKKLEERVLVIYSKNIESIPSSTPIKIEKTGPTSEICIIYTSGTTGNPKGVAILNQNIERVVVNNGFLDYDASDVILQLANYSFDGSLYNMFSALVNGGKLVIIPNGKYTDIEYLKNCILNERVTKFFVTTSLFNVMTDTIGKDVFKIIKGIIFGGEKASPKHCKKALRYLENGKLFNGYGPTEGGVFATAYHIKDITIPDNIPIGRPITNTKVYIVNYIGQMLPPTVTGEIYISGQALAHGYLNNDKATRKSFVHSPIKKDTLFYKTGDLGYMDTKGIIHYVGRQDNQYKIRGHRIELEEIEASINLNSYVKNAIIKATTKSDQIELICYFTSDSMGVKEFRQWVKQVLPEYMVPRKFYRISDFKMNKNGKIDRRSLDQLIIEKEEYDHDDVFSKLALQIKEAWETVLGQEVPSKRLNFYDVGGDSIKAVMLYSELQKKGIQMDMEGLISNPNIQNQEEYILYKQNSPKKETEKVQLVSPKYSRNLVLFPAYLPQFANKNMGNIIANSISEYSIYVASFSDERSLFKKYADEVEKIMGDGNSITFLGYSFGGNIAFEVIKELEKRGYNVDQLILVDSYMLEKFWFADPKDLVTEVDKYLEEYLSKDEVSKGGLRNDMLQQMTSYCDFINNYKGIYTPVKTDIYMITSSEPIKDDKEDLRVIWKNVTTKKFYLYHGFGNHREMWRTGYLEKNMVILNEIISEIQSKNHNSIQ